MVVDVADPACEIAERHDGEDRHQGVEQDMNHHREAPLLSTASTNRVMASRSAQPPGLRRRATKAACTAAARARQSGAPTPPCDRNEAAASVAYRIPWAPPRCRRFVSQTDAISAKHACTGAASGSLGCMKRPCRKAGQPAS